MRLLQVLFGRLSEVLGSRVGGSVEGPRLTRTPFESLVSVV